MEENESSEAIASVVEEEDRNDDDNGEEAAEAEVVEEEVDKVEQAPRSGRRSLGKKGAEESASDDPNHGKASASSKRNASKPGVAQRSPGSASAKAKDMLDKEMEDQDEDDELVSQDNSEEADPVDSKDAPPEDLEGEDRKVGKKERHAADAAAQDTAKKAADMKGIDTEGASYSTRGRSSKETSVEAKSEKCKTNTASENSVAVVAAAAAAVAATTTTTAASTNEQWEQSVRDAMDDFGRHVPKEPVAAAPTLGTSFLESLGEEERRTRTRFLPDVDGIHALRKNEVKGDLGLARTIMSTGGSVNLAASRKGKKTSTKNRVASGSDDAPNQEAIEDDDEEMDASPSDDDRGSDVGKIGASLTIEMGRTEMVIPSNAFVAPPATHPLSAAAPTNNNTDNEEPPPVPSSAAVAAAGKFGEMMRPPHLVDFVTAFSPPRPPESVGPKKKHRMLRWERRPADVEVNLNKYRKTVNRTQEELRSAEVELDRIESLHTHVRRNFLGQLKCIDEETAAIHKELESVHHQCISAADLLSSRTRSRGAGKATSYGMKEIVNILKQKEVELKEKGLGCDPALASDSATKNYPGIGGVGFASFHDHDYKSATLDIAPATEIAGAWILPQDRVQTPVGQGIVLNVYEPSVLDVSEPPQEALLKAAASPSPEKRPPFWAASKSPAKGKNTPKASVKDMKTLLGPRICVKLPFGIGYFSPNAVTSLEKPGSYPDSKLANRWKNILDTALMMRGSLDTQGMAYVTDDSADENESDSRMAIDEGDRRISIDGSDLKTRMIPFGSELLPTATGRGNHLCDMNNVESEKELHAAMTAATRPYGLDPTHCVPNTAKVAEADRQEYYVLKARVLQLRNELYRQRRIRLLNEKTYATSRDRSLRVESLVSEMRTDLKSLQRRLDDELKELGIDEEKEEEILKSFYLAQQQEDNDDEGDTTPQKRARRSDRMDHDDEEEEGEIEHDNGRHYYDEDEHVVNNHHPKRARISQ